MSTRSARPATLAGVIAFVVTACGDEAPDVDDRGVLDPGAAVSENLEILQAQLAYPPDGVYDVGEDADLYLAVANTGSTDDLLDVRGPDFAEALLIGHGPAGGIRIPADDTVHIGAEGSPAVVLRDVRTSLHPPESITVTLVFEEGGDLTVDAVVAAEGHEDPAFAAADPAADPPG